MKEDETLYVGVADPVDTRKDLLNSAREIIGSLRKYEEIIEIQNEKEKQTAELKKVVKEISTLSNRMKQIMPKSSVPKPAQRQKESQSKEEKIKNVSETKPSRIEELESQLSDVESKLRMME